MGPLGRLLGRLGADPKQHKNIMLKKTNFKTPMRPHPPDFRGGGWSPKTTKIGPKTNQNLRRFSRPKKLRFKSLLEPSWADLGALRPPKSCCGPHGARFFKNHIFSTSRIRKPNLVAKSPENDPKMTPQDDPKSIKNRCPKMIKILIAFKTDFMRFFGPAGGMRRPPGGILGG